MPRIDSRSGDIVIRVVYDGLPEAGKSTNIQQLFQTIPLQRRGALETPGSTTRRTEFFDWLDFAGGFVDGRRVRCQIVTVPGQPHVLRRRRYLLDTADVIVFVCESRAGALEASRESLDALLRRLVDNERGAPPVVVQANKQDMEDAVRPNSLLAALGLPAETPVVPAVASAGRGVLDTFVLATRLATDRVRGLLLEGSALRDLGEHEANANALHETMTRLDRDAEAIAWPSLDALLAAAGAPENDAAAAQAAQLPRAEGLLAGLVWPPVKGRGFVAAVMATPGSPPARARLWAPVQPVELALGAAGTLHSSGRWQFSSLEAARGELMRLVRAATSAGSFVPDGRAVFVAPDAAAYRLWVLTPALETLGERALSAIATRDARAFHATREHVGSVGARGDVASIALQGGALRALAVEDDASALRPLADSLDALVAKATRDHPVARAWLEEARALG